MASKLKVVVPVVIVGVGIAGALTLLAVRPEVETVVPETPAPLVRVVTVAPRTVRLRVDTQGTVLPRTEATLTAQVSGEVVRVAESFVVGGFSRRGEVLVELDARDYELAVKRTDAELARARLRLAREEAEARVAEEEWRRLGTGEPDPLLLRQPQVAEARAGLEAAEAELGQARLDLERTRIRAPFAGRLRSKHAEIGEFLGAGQPVAEIHAIDFAEIRLPIPHRDLAYLDLPLANLGDGELAGPAVRLSAEISGSRHAWPGRIVRSEGEIDPRSRMLYLVARVEDPYARETRRPPLAVGLFVQAEIAGRRIGDAYVLPRSALRDDHRVLIVDHEDRLRFRDVEVVKMREGTAVIGEGLAIGERVCVSSLEIVTDGMRVRTVEADEAVVEEAAEEGTAEEGTAEEESSPEEDRQDPVLPASDGAPEPTSSGAVLGRLLSIEVEASGGETRALVLATGELRPRVSHLDRPPRFVVDLPGVVSVDPQTTLSDLPEPIVAVRYGQFRTEPDPVSRIVFDLRRALVPQVGPAPGGLRVTFPGASSGAASPDRH